jgi:hypothetical protein
MVIQRPTARGRLPAFLAAASLAATTWSFMPEPDSPTAFVNGFQQQGLDQTVRGRVGMAAWKGGNSKQMAKWMGHRPKKTHIKYAEQVHQRQVRQVLPFLRTNQQFHPMREPEWMQYWSQNLRINFVEGEEDIVTEEEVMEYFKGLDLDFMPDGVITGYKTPLEYAGKEDVEPPEGEESHTNWDAKDIKFKKPVYKEGPTNSYVHFSTHEECVLAYKAVKEKGGTIGKASEVEFEYSPEEKWIRIKDGVENIAEMRSVLQKPYGSEMRDGWAEENDWKEAEWVGYTGSRNNPWYPY